MNTTKEAPYNLTEEGDGSKSNFDDLSQKIINKGVDLLKQSNFKFPDDLTFEQKINNIYNFQLNQYSNKIIALRGDDMFPEIAIRNHNYVLVQDADSTDEDMINSEELFQYNNYIFYNNRLAYDILKLKYPEVLKDLVIKYGYNKDKILIKWFLDEFDYSDKNQFFQLIFSFDPNENKYKIREQILNDITNILYDGKIEGFDDVKVSKKDCYQTLNNIFKKINGNKNTIKDPDKSIAILLDYNLSIGEVGNTELWLDNNKGFLDMLKKENFYNLKYLKEFTINIYQNKNDQGEYFIQDPDGYTNLRKDKNTTSEILQKVQSGEEVEVLDNTGDWWNVKTKEGKIGYIHKSRIKSNNNSVSVLRIYDRADFTSFSKEIQPKGEIEYVNKVNGWDFIKVDGRVGYIPTEEQKQEFANRPKRKNSFLAEDEPEPVKKKGFWDLFG